MTVDASFGSVDNPIDVYWFHNVEIDIGLGSNASAAHEIFASIRYQPAARDMRAALACRRHAPPDHMPTPERLQAALHRNRGEITLAPPLPNDHPSVSPTAAWSGTDAGNTHWQYRILLTRFSTTYPQEPTSNWFVSTNQNLLAWVVYTTHLTKNVPGCGGWGINADDRDGPPSSTNNADLH